MNTTAMAAIAAELARLTPQEHLLTSELAQKLRFGNKPMPVVDKPKRESQKFTHWSEEDTLIVMQFAEDSQRMTNSERQRVQRRLVRQLGRSPSGVKNKLWKIRHGKQ